MGLAEHGQRLSCGAQGQRDSSVVTVGSLTTTTTYVYDGLSLLNLAAQRSDGETYSITYSYGEDQRAWAAVYESSDTSSPTIFHPVTTDRGDVVELTDASGAPFAAYRYDAWGKVLSENSQAATGSLTATLAADITARQPLRYAGYCYDAESSTYYLSARQYDPATMQFLTKDPARADGEESAYQYCGGDPVGKVDPGGKHSSVIGEHWHWGGLFTWPFLSSVRAEYQSRIYKGVYQIRRRFYAYGGWNEYVTTVGMVYVPISKLVSAALGVATVWSGEKVVWSKDGKYGWRYHEFTVGWGNWHRP